MKKLIIFTIGITTIFSLGYIQNAFSQSDVCKGCWREHALPTAQCMTKEMTGGFNYNAAEKCIKDELAKLQNCLEKNKCLKK